MPTQQKNRYLLDIFLGLALFLALVWLALRIKSGLVYHWDWSAIWQYLFRYDTEKARWTTNLLDARLFHDDPPKCLGDPSGLFDRHNDGDHGRQP